MIILNKYYKSKKNNNNNNRDFIQIEKKTWLFCFISDWIKIIQI